MKTKNTWLIGAAVVVLAALFTGCSNPEAGTEYVTEYGNIDLDHITVTTNPAKLNYGPYEPFTSAGLVVSAYFNDNTTAQLVSGFTLSWNGQPLAEGSTAISGGDPGYRDITATWRDKSANFGILVTGGNTFSDIDHKSKWDAAIQAIKAGGNNQAYVLTISGDFEVDPSSSGVYRTFGTVNGLTVTLQGSGKLTLNNNGSIFYLQGSAAAAKQTLNLYGNITLEGRKVGGNGNETNNAPVVYVGSYAVLDMHDGRITGNSTTSNGGGVYVYSSDSSFTMSGGEISGNTTSSQGGGVNVGSGSSFTMSGNAVISGNSGSYGGGVLVGSGSSFTMSGGKIISGNTASSQGGGVAVYASSGAIFTMSGGEISGNTVSGNGASGGGVWVYNGSTFNMSGSAVISGNKAAYGGGVHVEATGTFTKSGGVIYGDGDHTFGNENPTDNTATYITGGNAVYVESSPAKRRESTAEAGDDLNSAVTPGGWEYY